MPHNPPLCHGSNWLFDYGSAYVCLSFRRWQEEAEQRQRQYGGKVKPRLWGCSPCDWPYRVWLYDSSTSSNLNWPCNAVEGRVLKGWGQGKPLCTFICGVYVMRKGKQLCVAMVWRHRTSNSRNITHTHTHRERFTDSQAIWEAAHESEKFSSPASILRIGSKVLPAAPLSACNAAPIINA